MSYQSPIELFQTEPTLEQIKSETDAYILQSVWKLGVNVHKDELIKALAYDRDQYDKDYHDGRMYQPPVKTNADRIRAMTDKELCAFLCDLIDCSVCPGSEACENGCGWDKENKVMKGLYAWLKQEAE